MRSRLIHPASLQEAKKWRNGHARAQDACAHRSQLSNREDKSRKRIPDHLSGNHGPAPFPLWFRLRQPPGYECIREDARRRLAPGGPPPSSGMTPHSRARLSLPDLALAGACLADTRWTHPKRPFALQRAGAMDFHLVVQRLSQRFLHRLVPHHLSCCSPLRDASGLFTNLLNFSPGRSICTQTPLLLSAV
jgi:hypothetical protein